MDMTVSLITAISTIIGAIISGAVSLLVSSKQYDKSMALIEYRIGELEGKMDKHNNLVERVAIVERDLKTNWTRVDEIKAEVKTIRG